MNRLHHKLFPALAATLLLGACASLQPVALTPGEIAATTRADREAARLGVEPLLGALTLEEAIARAVKYNADRRLRLMEEAVARGTLDVSRRELLPQVVASAGYRERDKDLLTLSKDLSNGAIIGGQTISSSRSASTADLGFSWSLLDFGQSYYAARQNADRVLVAAERRRKALHILIQDVRTAFWRTVSAQKLGAALRQAIGEAESAIAEAQQAEKEQLRSPLEPLRYQLQVLENLRLLEAIEQELSTARIELAALINHPPGQGLEVVEPEAPVDAAWLAVPVEAMEEQALMRNADLRESIYNGRIARMETRRVLMKMFPGLSFNYGYRSSDDPFLIHRHWTEAGVQISFNLLGLLSAPAQRQLAEAGVALADQKRMSTQLAVLAQLHVARQLYGSAARQFQRADAIAQVNARISQHVDNQAQATKLGRQERVAQQAAAILYQLRRYQALAQAHAAASRLQATLGLEPDLGDADTLPVAELSRAVGRSLQDWATGVLPGTPGADAAGAEGRQQ